MKISHWLPVFILTLLLTACEKPIDFSPRNSEPKLVVEGVIENDQYPVIYLSRSLNYFNNISLADLASSFVRNAQVTLSDGTVTYPLVEHAVPVADGYSVYYYSFDTTSDNRFRGETGRKYELSIKVDGLEYSASTTIPQLSKTLDSLYYMENVDDEDSSRVVLYGKFTDPAGYGNYSRYFTSVNSGPFLPGLASVYDDQVIDGTSYKIQIEQGVDRSSDVDFEDYSYFYKGDNIIVKFCNIDKGVFDFWRTMEYSYSSIGNPFSSPTRIIGNISNGALGYFGGYAVQYVSIFVPQ